MKIKLTENDIKKLINETIKKYIKESYGYTSIFEDNQDLINFEKLVYEFTTCEIDKKDYVDEPYFDDFIDGCIKLYNMSIEYQDYIKYNFADLYKNAISNGDEDLFWNNENVINYDYIDDFIYHIDDWNNSMPKPEVVKNYIDMFAEWLKDYMEYEIDNYTRTKWKEYKSCIGKINDAI